MRGKMNNKANHMISLLFVAITLLLLIGSVSADVVDLNENVEASLDLDDSSSVIDEEVSYPDNKVSNQAISNIDVETKDLDSNLNSQNVVSNNDDNDAIDLNDSKKIKADNQLGDSQDVLRVVPLTPTVNVGDMVSFEISGNAAGYYYGSPIPAYLAYEESQMHFDSVVANMNTVTVENASPFDGHDCKLFKSTSTDGRYNFTVNFKTLISGNYGCFVYLGGWVATDIAYINAISLKAVPLTPTVNVGDRVSFEISGYSVGTYGGSDIFVNVLYDESEMRFDSVVANMNAVSLVDSSPMWNHDRRLFKSTSSDGRYNFTVNFITASSGHYGCYAIIGENGPSQEAYINANSLQNVPLTPTVKVGDKVSFEISGYYVGPNGVSDIIVNLLYDESQMRFDSVVANKNAVTTVVLEDTWMSFKSTSTDGRFNFTVNFITAISGHYGCYSLINWDGAGDIAYIDANSWISLQNVALNSTVKVGDNVSFEISGHSVGDYDGSDILVNLFYDESEMSFDSVVANMNAVTLVDSSPMDGHDHMLFKSTSTDGRYNFTVTFKTLISGHYGCHAVIGDDGAYQTRYIDANPWTAFQNIALNETASFGGIISFEISGYTVGTYDGSPIPVTLLYNESEMHFVSFTPNMNTVTMEEPGQLVGYDRKLFKSTSTDGRFNFTVNFKAISIGEYGCFAFWEDWGRGASATSDVDYTNPYFQLQNAVSSPYTNVGMEVSFTITGRNVGTRYEEDYIPITILYMEDQLSFIDLKANANSEFYSSVEYGMMDGGIEMWNTLFIKYFTPEGFGGDDCFNFTVTLRGVKEYQPYFRGGYGVYAFVGTDNHEETFEAWGATNVTIVGPESDFNIDVKNVNGYSNGANVNLGGIAAFEIFVRNIGENFYEIVPMDIYFNPEELEFVGYAIGVNPDAPTYNASKQFIGPVVEDGHVYFGYDGADSSVPYDSFMTNHCLNFTVYFKTLKLGTPSINTTINWSQTISLPDWTKTFSYQRSRSASTIVGLDADFKLDYSPVDLIVDTDGNVSYNLFVRNIGADFGAYVPIDIYFNPEELEYSNYVVGVNPDAPSSYDTSACYSNPYIENGHLRFIYEAKVINAFRANDCLNFTIVFKPKANISKKYTTTAAIAWMQIESHRAEASASVFASENDFVIDIVALEDLLQIGDIANFEVTAHNKEGTYQGRPINFDLYYNPDELDYYNFIVNEQPRGSFDLESSSLQSSNGNLVLLSATRDNERGHLKFVYTPVSVLGAAAGDSNCAFNFTVGYTVLATGYIQSNASLMWMDQGASMGSEESPRVFSENAGIRVGNESHKVSAIPVDDRLEVGDIVEYELYIVNDGTAPKTINDKRLVVDDWFPAELEYLGFVNNTEHPVTVIQDPNNPLHLNITQYMDSNQWMPGDCINITLKFRVHEQGIHCNHIYFDGNWSVGSVIVGQPNMTLNKTVLNPVVELYDLVYYEIYCKNDENSIPYMDHTIWPSPHDRDLIISDIYPDGLEFVRLEYDDSEWPQKGTLVVNEGTGNNISVVFTPANEEKWQPGSYIKFTLVFNATKSGKLTNNAEFYWKWRDWENKNGPEENITLTSNSSVVVGAPSFSLEKISNYENVKVGDILSYSLIYTNTGYRDLTGVYIIDRDYSDGLEYIDYSDKGLWTYDGNGRWDYNGVLEAGESVTLELFFKALTPGDKTNTAIAGNGYNNVTSNSTDTVLVKVDETSTPEESEDELDDSEDELDDFEDNFDDDDEGGLGDEEEEEGNSTDSNSTETGNDLSVSKNVSKNATGNPLFVLFIALLTLCFVPLRGKK